MFFSQKHVSLSNLYASIAWEVSPPGYIQAKQDTLSWQQPASTHITKKFKKLFKN